MKSKIKNFAFIFIAILGLASCSSDNENPIPEPDELVGLTQFQVITNDTHVIEFYNQKGSLEQGYNDITLRIKDKATNAFVKNATVSWIPRMHMTMMTHSCPYSLVQKVANDGTTFNGYIVFQMAQNGSEFWDLQLTYTINDKSYSEVVKLNVPASAKQRVISFTGADKVKYVIAAVAPSHPKVAVNDFSVMVFKMKDMMSFPVVDGYKVKIDPRMPSMGNHGSPNNVDLTQVAAGNMYDGKLSLTMSGYWRINLQLLNASQEVLKGEAITTEVPESSLYLELEF